MLTRSYANTVGHLTRIEANWTVPAEPTSHQDQVIFLFPGLQGATSGGVNCILQPVLQWGVSAAGGGQSWNFASWCVGSAGTVTTSLAYVVPGQYMSGTVSSASCNSAWSKCDWTVTTCAMKVNQTGNVCRSLTKSNLDPVDYAVAAALEVYRITSCSEYPATGSTTLTGVKLWRNGALIAPAYAGSVASVSPSCNLSTSQSGTSITLRY